MREHKCGKACEIPTKINWYKSDVDNSDSNAAPLEHRLKQEHNHRKWFVSENTLFRPQNRD